MRAKVYKGLSNDIQYPFYFIIRNMEFDVSKSLDASGKPYTYIETINCNGEIKSWKPFFAEYKDYTGKQAQKIFTCPVCGSHDCERPNHKEYADPHYYQGSFKCSKCGASDFNYYSDCFLSGVKQYQQLSLF
jgi:hypothetical protein